MTPLVVVQHDDDSQEEPETLPEVRAEQMPKREELPSAITEESEQLIVNVQTTAAQAP